MMKKDIERRCVELTQTAITRFWQRDPEYVLSLCSDDVMWISPDQDRYMRGLDEVSADFRKAVHDIKSSHISHAQFSVAQNCGDACSVAGRYMVTTDEETGVFLQSHERCQFNWERKGGELRIVSIFVSWPRDQRVPDEKCRVDSINKVARRYLEARIAAQSDKRRLVFPDVNGPIRFVSLNEVLWVGAKRKHTIIHTVSGDYEASIGLSEVERSLGPGFVRVHRSFIVNPSYVALIERREVVMSDDTRVPVPEKRHAEVAARLMRTTN